MASAAKAPESCLPMLPSECLEVFHDPSVVKELHGTKAADPYRWLDDLDSTETHACVCSSRGGGCQSMHMTRRSYSGTICYGGICGSGSGRPVAAIGSCRCSSGGHKGSGAGDHGAGSCGCCLPLEQRAVAGCKQAMFRGKQRRMRKQALWLCAVVLCALLCLPPVQAQPPTGSAAPAADEPSPGSDILEAFEFLIEILQKLLELLKLCLQLWAIRAALAPRPAGNVPQAGAGGANGVV